jgi:hypothetical protein
MNQPMISPEIGNTYSSLCCHKRRRLTTTDIPDDNSSSENDTLNLSCTHNALNGWTRTQRKNDKEMRNSISDSSLSLKKNDNAYENTINVEHWRIKKMPNNNQYRNHCCHFDNIPKDVFLKIISFIGPASPTLTPLSQVNKQFAHIMKQVGEAILVQAKMSYRTLLPKLNYEEPLLSLCTRHVRCYQDIMNKVNTIKKILDKSFVNGCLGEALIRGYIDQSSVNDLTTAMIQRSITTSTASTQSNDSSTMETDDKKKKKEEKEETDATVQHLPITLHEIDQALDTTLDLLGCDNITYFIENNAIINIPRENIDPSFFTQGRKSLLEFLSKNIEHQILTLCGKCGGKVFKYCKMLTLLQEQGIRRNNDNNTVNIIGNDNPASSTSLLPPTSIIQSFKDEERYDRSRLIMQLVVHRFMRIERSNLVSKATVELSSSSSTATTIPSTTSEEAERTTTATDSSLPVPTTVSPITDSNHSHSVEEHRSVGSNDSKKEDDGQKEDEGQSLYSWLEG